MAKRSSVLALFLFIVLLGHAMASVMMVRREAPDTTLAEEGQNPTQLGADAAAKEKDPTAEGAPAETKPAESDAPAETEPGAPEPTETEAGGEVTGETEESKGEEAGKSVPGEVVDEDIYPNEDGSPDIGFQTGLVFGAPFVTLRQMQKYFFDLERTLHRIFESTLNQAAEDPNVKNATTSEVMTVGGHKYLVNRTTIKEGDGNSSIVIKSISIVPAEERRKRALMDLA